MNPSLDLNILPLSYRDGQEEANPVDLYAVMPPKRPAHGREHDSLILYLNMAGNAPLLPEQQVPLMERLAQKFYKTPGSVTAALRSLAEGLNLHLLERNLRISGGGKQGVGLFMVAVLRSDTLYLAHCGPVHSILVTPTETQVMHDPSGAGRGLGLSKTTQVRFYQARMQSGDYLVLAPRAPEGWLTSGLRHTPRLGIEGMRRHLLEQAGAEMSSGTISATLLQAHSGDGKLRLLKRKPGVPDMAHTGPVSASGAALPEAQPAPSMPTLAEAPTESISTETPPPPAAPAEAVPSAGLRRISAPQPSGAGAVPVAAAGVAAEAAAQAAVSATPAAARPSQPPKAQPAPKKPKKERRTLRKALAPLLAGMGAIGRAVGNTLDSAGRSLGRLGRSLLPDEGLLHLPPSAMLFIALAIPLVIATIGGVIYIRRGRAAQYQVYYDQAVIAAQNAAGQTEAAPQRASWELVLGALDSAEFYQVTPESEALRNQVQAALDDLDEIERLDFKPALDQGSLEEEFIIQRMVSNGSDLYLLDGVTGNVLRVVMSASGFEIDTAFKCGPSFGPLVVGPLVDIVALPLGIYDEATEASILGIDAGGNLLFCMPDGTQPLAVQPALPGNFTEATNVEVDGGDLYVLDPQSKAVWLYNRMEIDQLPRDFFGEDRPDDLVNAIDMAIDLDDLFLLHADGQVSKCIYSGLTESPTRCEEPYPYTDKRAGRESGEVMEETSFEEIYYSPPPGPAIYMLDPQPQAIYYFSPRLAMQSQYRPVSELPGGPATAFAINISSAQRLAFLAIGTQVYYAALP
jgi:hypothetical protein